MTDKNEIIRQIEELLGDEGTREIAEAVFPLLKKHNYVTFDAQRGFVLWPMPDDDDTFTSIVAEAEKSLRPLDVQGLLEQMGGKCLVIDHITDDSETAASCTVRPLAGGVLAFPGDESIEVTDPTLIRALYGHPTAKSYGEGSYTVELERVL